MPRALLQSGMELEYDTTGSPEDEPILLVMGFTAQMTGWPDDFCKQLADTGRFVIRFDNRDCGLSSKLDGVEIDIASLMAAVASSSDAHTQADADADAEPDADAEAPAPEIDVPYTLRDMAEDAFGLLDHLGIESAHVIGASMGGMIAQTMAIERPERVRTLVSIMSTTGEPDVGQPAPEAMVALLAPPPDTREEIIEAVSRYAVFQSKRYYDVEKSRERVAAAYDRSYYPEGAPRQMGAMFASRDRAERLPSVTAPTLVIHGREDTLIAPSGGMRTAELIPGAHLLLVADMGHDMPEPLWPVLIGNIAIHTAPRS